MSSSVYDSLGRLLTTKRVYSKDTEEVVFMVSLMNKAFPYYAQRDDGGFEQALENTALVECYCVYVDIKIAGFYCIWRLEEYIYLEYIVMEEEYRSSGVMSAIFSRILAQETMPFIAEVERPTTEIARRRIVFYKRLGWEILDAEYMQPPLQKGDSFLPRYLLQHKAHSNTASMSPEYVVSLLCTYVYNTV